MSAPHGHTSSTAGPSSGPPQGARQAQWETGGRATIPWDVIIIGGGISGAGILLEAARAGLRAILVEQGDFASGTSSRSSKLVHGGLRYLATGDWRLTQESVRERQRLLREAPGLVAPQRFLVPIYAGSKPRRWEMQIGLRLYDLFAGGRYCYELSAADALRLTPGLDPVGLRSAFSFQDADTDDARLVLRVLREATAAGGSALNYVRATELLRDNGRVSGLRVRDILSGEEQHLNARVVINATGVWAEDFTLAPEYKNQLRPLRGSHLLVPLWRMPLGQGVSWQHHEDRRNVFVYPWANVALIGTTDLDHQQSLAEEPRHSEAEARYLLDAVNRRFPQLGLRPQDVISTYAGVRPVVSSGAADPSAESRESALWVEPGLVTLSGGKLTTFRVAAQQVLEAARPDLPSMGALDETATILNPGAPWQDARLSAAQCQRLRGLYGGDAQSLLADADEEWLQTIGPTPHLWAELVWACREEAVCNLDDLLLRRTRIGLLLPNGASVYLAKIQELVQDELGWSDTLWEEEVGRYLAHWRDFHGPPSSGLEAAL